MSALLPLPSRSTPRLRGIRRVLEVGAGLAILLCSVPTLAAQSASSDVSSRSLVVGETVTFTVTLRGGRGDRVSAPLASGALELVSRSPILDATTIINGDTERQLAWAYRARRPGTGQIRPFRARVNGTPITAPGATVAVSNVSGVPPSRPQAPSGVGRNALFVRAEPSRRTAYVGQQVVVDYVLYFEPEIQPRQTAPVGTWDAAGAWREEMDVPTAYPRPATINGRPYEAVTIRRVALFPTRDGTLELAPMRFTIDLVRITGGGRSSDPFAPFFTPFSQRFEDREVTAPAATVDVRPLPDGAPDAFAGAVGDFSMTTTVDDRRVQAGDPVRVQVTVRGTGNTALLEPPALEVPAGVDAYDPSQDREAFRSSEPL
ncbi:BatD family protein, partial [Rubrivirga sp.]|uniref:BatD family protein n=1 Tax=Rubrivirga sp. TaxID=1885344 RepID=UPI003C73F3FD